MIGRSLRRAAIRQVMPRTDGCKACLPMNKRPVLLRLCLSCGHIGCGDSSLNQPTPQHRRSTQYPIVQSFDSNEDWVWGYLDTNL